MLDSIYHMTLKLLKNHQNFAIFYATLWMTLRYATNMQTTSGLSILLHGIIHCQRRHHVIKYCIKVTTREGRLYFTLCQVS